MEIEFLWNTSTMEKKQKDILAKLRKENKELSKKVTELNEKVGKLDAIVNFDKADIKTLNTKLNEANRRIEVQEGIISDMTDGKYFENKTQKEEYKEVEYVDYCDI